MYHHSPTWSHVPRSPSVCHPSQRPHSWLCATLTKRKKKFHLWFFIWITVVEPLGGIAAISGKNWRSRLKALQVRCCFHFTKISRRMWHISGWLYLTSCGVLGTTHVLKRSISTLLILLSIRIVHCNVSVSGPQMLVVFPPSTETQYLQEAKDTHAKCVQYRKDVWLLVWKILF